MSGGGYDYGRSGIVGIGTPQANPTVEAEMRILLPPSILPVVARLTSKAAEAQARLCEYLVDLPATLEQFDTLRPYAFGFACTGSSYLVERSEARRVLDAVEDRFGFPVVTAADAISHALRGSGARRIALASPYPQPLAAAARRHWEAEGFAVEAVRQIAIAGQDTRAIYALGSADAATAAAELSRLPVDAVVLSGTGMPSLALLADPPEGPPLLSSNQCLADRLAALAPRPAPDPEGWRPRLASATAA